MKWELSTVSLGGRRKGGKMSEELKPANQHPDFGKVCIHGSLKRQCYTCELEVSNDWLKKVNQNLRDEIDLFERRAICPSTNRIQLT